MKQKKIAIIYIGYPRFKEIGYKNHKKMIDRIDELYDLKIYDFTFPNIDRSDCFYKDSGRIQVYDFYTALDHVEEDICIKLRTDLWITDSAIDAILEELFLVTETTQDFSFCGMGLIRGSIEFYKEKYFKLPVTKTGKVLDWIIIANRNKLSSKEKILEQLDTSPKLIGGNKAFTILPVAGSNCAIVCCQIYLIRKTYDSIPDDCQVGIDMLKLFGNGITDSQIIIEWLETIQQDQKLTP